MPFQMFSTNLIHLIDFTSNPEEEKKLRQPLDDTNLGESVSFPQCPILLSFSYI